MGNKIVEEKKEVQLPKTALSLFKDPKTISKFSELLGDKSSSFLASVTSLISQNSMLKNADPTSVFLAARTSATLDLPINPNLGFAYVIPYKGFDGVKAQFQIGYKGLIQLALRSGQFLNIGTCAVYEGQLVEENPLKGHIFDRSVKKTGDPVGYAGYFKLVNGFEKISYMTKDEMEAHGTKFSQTYKKKKGVRVDDFDGMAKKTVLKLLLSKYAPLSIDMQKAVVVDQGFPKDESLENIDYIDNGDKEPISEKEKEKMDEELKNFSK